MNFSFQSALNARMATFQGSSLKGVHCIGKTCLPLQLSTAPRVKFESGHATSLLNARVGWPDNPCSISTWCKLLLSTQKCCSKKNETAKAKEWAQGGCSETVDYHPCYECKPCYSKWEDSVSKGLKLAGGLGLIFSLTQVRVTVGIWNSGLETHLGMSPLYCIKIGFPLYFWFNLMILGDCRMFAKLSPFCNLQTMVWLTHKSHFVEGFFCNLLLLGGSGN